jgi:hypothetical protein
MSVYASTHLSNAQLHSLNQAGWALATALAFSMIVLVVLGLTV